MVYGMDTVRRIKSAIANHKILFVLLVVFQILALVSLVFVTVHYQVKMISDAQGIIQQVQGANYEQTSLEAGQPFLQDMASVTQLYSSIQHNVLFLGLWFVIIFISFQAIVWLLSHAILRTKTSLQKIVQWWIKYTLSSLIFFIFTFSTLYILFSNFFFKDPESISGFVSLAGIITLVLYYFLLVTLTFITTPTWKQFIRNIINVAIKKIHMTLLVVLITMGVLGLIGYGITFLMQTEKYFFIALLALFIFLIAIIVARLFIILSLQRFAQK